MGKLKQARIEKSSRVSSKLDYVGLSPVEADTYECLCFLFHCKEAQGGTRRGQLFSEGTQKQADLTEEEQGGDQGSLRSSPTQTLL